MQTSKPTIIIIPGAWQKSIAFRDFANSLTAIGFPTEIIELPSVGSTYTPLPGLAEDAAAVRSAVMSALDKSQDVILLCHSYGGLVGSNAAKGLDTKTRTKNGLAGGIKKIIFISAFVIPSGSSLFDLMGGQPAKWMDVHDDKVSISLDAMTNVGFNDLSPNLATEAIQLMTHSSASVFVTASAFEPWANDIPCAYIFTTEDCAIPYTLQQHMAKQLGPEMKSVTLKAGHCSFLSVPDQVLEAVKTLNDS